MPKGKHKGGKRHFTNFEAMEEQKKKEEKERRWRKEQGETDSEEEEDEEGKKKEPGSGSSSSEEESSSGEEGEVKEQKAKGVSNLIECENPNRVANKPKKVTSLPTTTTTTDKGSGKVQLSRREREEIEKQRATAHYRKLHAEGKTEEARADLARLAIIKQQREDAAKKREDERKAREDAANAKREQLARVLNKKKS